MSNRERVAMPPAAKSEVEMLRAWAIMVVGGKEAAAQKW